MVVEVVVAVVVVVVVVVVVDMAEEGPEAQLQWKSFRECTAARSIYY